MKPAKKTLNLCLALQMGPFQYQKPLTLLQDLIRQLSFGDAFLTFPSLHLPGVDFQLIQFPLQSLIKAFQMCSHWMIQHAVLAVIPVMKLRVLPRPVHTLYTPLPWLYNLQLWQFIVVSVPIHVDELVQISETTAFSTGIIKWAFLISFSTCTRHTSRTQRRLSMLFTVLLWMNIWAMNHQSNFAMTIYLNTLG